ncbi:acetate/propionate family kinase [Ruegeria profundi]|uniref:Acetate kinase n=1 Tax=Ruegeria profundi TaxID=1685378 RepID=A0A0X3TZS5_9RHOB|nr:acetate/propionate family kinase [Ruegeria profundi]KUJ81273.1 acetate kinase [Ruegeria profundi]
MVDHVLALNAGSSSLKFGLYELAENNLPCVRWHGQIERLGDAPRLLAKFTDGQTINQPLAKTQSHDEAIRAFLEMAREQLPDINIRAVGHRVVHGGAVYSEPVLVDQKVMDTLAGFIPFAPLHQPFSLTGIRAAIDAFPGTAQVACFDTAFHRTHPWVNDTFALPLSYYEKGVRRYGFHGLSYDYIMQKLKEIAPSLYDGRVVIAHLGNGASMCAVSGGRAVASTMGFSALDGLPMGTRSGQLDPGVVLYMMQQEGMSADEIADTLYRKSGLLGLSRLSSDMRKLLAAETPEARRAIDYYVFRVRRELGALSAALEGLDALVFTGGIGENAAQIRRRVCEGMRWIGIEIDPNRNADNGTVLSTDFSRVRILRIPTNEEMVIARAAARMVQ